MTTPDDGVRGDFIRMLIVDAAEKWSDPHTRRDARIELEEMLAELSTLRERAEAAEADVTRQMAIANEAVNARIAAEAALEAMWVPVAEGLHWIASFAAVRAEDDSKTFARVNRGALRTIRDRATATLAFLASRGK